VRATRNCPSTAAPAPRGAAGHLTGVPGIAWRRRRPPALQAPRSVRARSGRRAGRGPQRACTTGRRGRPRADHAVDERDVEVVQRRLQASPKGVLDRLPDVDDAAGPLRVFEGALPLPADAGHRVPGFPVVRDSTRASANSRARSSSASSLGRRPSTVTAASTRPASPSATASASATVDGAQYSVTRSTMGGGVVPPGEPGCGRGGAATSTRGAGAEAHTPAASRSTGQPATSAPRIPSASQ
jgi:hypothetical protein